jgi:nucleoside-triphosphatase THEP1
MHFMNTIIHKPLNSLWLKASVIGSFWASIEIILGSFLHNLKVPLSGTILSFISVFLLISFLQIWKENGLVLRAGIICALMKSISPSALIIGPMIGIFTEAMLLEFFIWFLGKNLLGYMAGGAFAILSALLHKLVSLIILYGFDFVKILNALYQFAVKQVHLSDPNPLHLVTLIVLIYLLTGILAAVSGYLTGKKYMSSRGTSAMTKGIKIEYEEKTLFIAHEHGYSVFNLFLNTFAVIVGLLIINSERSVILWLIPLIYILYCVMHYKSSLNRLKKISLWLQFIIITAIAAFLMNGISGESMFSLTGLTAGLKMISRAVVVIIGFAAISIELKNPVVKSVLYGRGFASLYQSINLSFSALGSIISSMPESGSILRQTRTFMRGILSQAENLFKIFESETMKRSPVIIITGDIGQGKTTYIKKIVSNLQNHNTKIAGFLSVGIDANGERSGFRLHNIQTAEQVELCTKVHHMNWLRYGSYYFNPAGIQKGKEILNKANLEGIQLIVIDEIGPLEINDNGWSGSIDNLCQNTQTPQLWVVRKSLTDKIIKKWNIGNVYIFDISEDSVDDAENKILELIHEQSLLRPDAKK